MPAYWIAEHTITAPAKFEEHRVKVAPYKTAVAIAKGERLVDVAVDTLNLDPSITKVLKAADEILYRLADGATVTEAAYQSLQHYLPAEAQQGMDYARRFIRGENVPQMILSQAEQVAADGVKNAAQSILDRAAGGSPAELAAARDRVNSIYNQYAAEFGYQMAADRLADDARGWIQLGLVGGASLRNSSQQFVGTFGSLAETNTLANNDFEKKGKALIASGISYKRELVSKILQGNHFAIDIDFFDSLNQIWIKRPMNYNIIDAWRRGFTIAIGVCEGSSKRGPGQDAAYQTMAEKGGRDGFDAGQAVQFSRTIDGNIGMATISTTPEISSSAAHKLGNLKVNDLGTQTVSNKQKTGSSAAEKLGKLNRKPKKSP